MRTFYELTVYCNGKEVNVTYSTIRPVAGDVMLLNNGSRCIVNEVVYRPAETKESITTPNVLMESIMVHLEPVS